MTEPFITFNALPTDQEKWEWLAKNQDKGILVNCDNDETFITVDGNDDEYATFDNYIGWSDGVFSLLAAMGIRAEAV